MPAEIQIRSVFEDAWGEVDHKLFYEADRQGHLAGTRERLAASRHLGILKSMLDTAEEYAAVIEDVNFGAPPDSTPDIKKNLDDVAYMRELCAPLDRNKELLNEMIALTSEKFKLDESVRTGAANPTAYVSLAEQFEDLAARFHRAGSVTGMHAQRYRSVLYLVDMEEALCRLLSGNRAQMGQAVAAYETITSKYKEYPTCWFRRGQACAQLMEKIEDDPERERLVSEAVASYRHARELLVKPIVNVKDDLLISPSQRNYLELNIERLQGFVLWRVTDFRRRSTSHLTADDLEKVFKAYKIASEGLNLPDNSDNVPLLNNATYFALDVAQIATVLKAEKPGLPGVDDISDMVENLERNCREGGLDAIGLWHTILMGQTYLKDRERQLHAARKVTEIHADTELKGVSEYEREIHERAFRDAWNVLRGALPPDPG